MESLDLAQDTKDFLSAQNARQAAFPFGVQITESVPVALEHIGEKEFDTALGDAQSCGRPLVLIAPMQEIVFHGIASFGFDHLPLANGVKERYHCVDSDLENDAIFIFCTATIKRIICIGRCRFPVRSRRTLSGNVIMDKIRIRDDKLIKNAQKFGIIRTIFLILAIMVFLGIVLGLLFYSGPNEIENEVGSGISGFIILVLISYCCHLRIQHIESIRYYRQTKDQT